jgi:hypothetical protein
MGRYLLAFMIFLMATALYGIIVIEFIFVCATCIVVTSIVFAAVLVFFKSMDRIIDFFYRIR